MRHARLPLVPWPSLQPVGSSSPAATNRSPRTTNAFIEGQDDSRRRDCNSHVRGVILAKSGMQVSNSPRRPGAPATAVVDPLDEQGILAGANLRALAAAAPIRVRRGGLFIAIGCAAAGYRAVSTGFENDSKPQPGGGYRADPAFGRFHPARTLGLTFGPAGAFAAMAVVIYRAFRQQRLGRTRQDDGTLL